MREDPAARDVRDDWREPVMVVRPRLAELAASNAGISRSDVSRTLQRNFSGLTVGVFREGDVLVPMVARAPAAERLDVDNIQDVQIWSPMAGGTIPLRQVVSGFETQWDDGIVARRNRLPTITPRPTPSAMSASCSSGSGPASRRGPSAGILARVGGRVRERLRGAGRAGRPAAADPDPHDARRDPPLQRAPPAGHHLPDGAARDDRHHRVPARDRSALRLHGHPRGPQPGGHADPERASS